MNTDPSHSRNHQAVENVRNELHKLYWETVGKEPDPEVMWKDAKNFVAKFGPDASLLRTFVLKLSSSKLRETSQNCSR